MSRIAALSVSGETHGGAVDLPDIVYEQALSLENQTGEREGERQPFLAPRAELELLRGEKKRP